MTNVLIGIVGEDKDCEEVLFKGFKRFYPDVVVLLVKSKYVKSAKRIEKNLRKHDIDINVYEISNFPSLEEVFMKIRDMQSLYDEDTIVINVDCDYMTSCIALSSAFVNGIAAIGILDDEIIAYPIMKFSYYNAVNDKKMEILRHINNKGEFDSMEMLSKKSKMSLPLIAYHLRGNKDSEGLVSMNLVKTKKTKSGVCIKLTELGKLIANGYVDINSGDVKKKMKKEYDLVVIGAGSGGLTAAIGGAQIGAKVMLIEKEKIGGDCTHYGCIPSKTLIKASKVAKEIRNSKKYGLGKANVDIDLKNVLEKVQKTVKSVYSHETPKEISKLGIGVEIGSAKFLDKRCVEVNGKKVTSKKFIIATGSRARVPQIKGLSEIDYMTNRTIFSPKKYSSIAVLGGGPIGSELGQALSNLGVNVTIINNVSYIIPREDMDASMLVEKEMIRDRVKIYNNSSVYEIKQKGKRKIVNIENVKSSKIESIEVDEVLVAVGRVPNIEDLGLDEAGVLYNKRGVIVDSSGRSSNRNIYAIGDVAGGFQFTHLANSHGKSVLAKTIFKIPSKFERDVIPRVTFTIPQVGSVGINESQKDDSDFVLKLDYNKVDRAVTDSDTNGFYKIIVNRKGFIRGAVIVGEGAGELIGELAFAMKNMIKVTKLADTIHPYPTYAYGLRNCCDKFRAMFYNENKKKWVKRIFNLRG